MLPADLKHFKPSEEPLPAVVRLLDLMAFVTAAGMGLALWIVVAAILEAIK